ncbi:hypothetical protein SuNHUV7_27800 (plasmid) [Pseudoseohaeicola sp. NH-UV-7]|uniref:hypothetical protein n=1 Tax=unclassified Sulfitobacter TaxID=196795 RepID=UPI000E0C6622|nr:hypothetical protein [Sulfitobacter sp. JL08]AXI55412.1 hypothetical protein C1J05_13645 [Sulfitobacter sp. JL08]
MIEVAEVLGGVVLTFIIWIVLSFVAGWRRNRRLFGFLFLFAILFHAVWIKYGVGESPLDPPALTSQLAVLFYGCAAYVVGLMFGGLSRLIRGRKKPDPSNPDHGS